MTAFRFLIGRLAQAAFTLWGVTVILFLLFHLLPGSPAESLLGLRATTKQIRALNHRLGYDHSVLTQYLGYANGLVHGDLGHSLVYDLPAKEIVLQTLPHTAVLACLATALTLVVSVVLASACVLWRGTWVDRFVAGLPVVVIALPTFWVALVLLYVFGFRLGWLPTGGLEPGWMGETRSFILPAVSLAAVFAGILVRNLRANLLDLLDSPFVEFATLKGISRSRVIRSHVLPNAAIPTLTLLALMFAGLFGGALVVESIFGLPGLGSLMVRGFATKDFPLVQGVVLVGAIVVLGVNILVDLLYSLLDPRVGLR